MVTMDSEVYLNLLSNLQDVYRQAMIEFSTIVHDCPSECEEEQPVNAKKLELLCTINNAFDDIMQAVEEFESLGGDNIGADYRA